IKRWTLSGCGLAGVTLCATAIEAQRRTEARATAVRSGLNMRILQSSAIVYPDLYERQFAGS
ncbi:hypothetical protein, partial [Rhizobium brockwellii]|uniref:hypothetical protein n=1 Tax=Rhizobium brockwellii TaxID=3019932 RepID=UPI003F97BDEC